MSKFTNNFLAPSHGVELRNEALTLLSSLPVPTRRNERWKYSSVSKLINASLETYKGGEVGIEGWPKEINPNPVPQLEAYRIVFRNGVYEPTLSELPTFKGVVCMPLSSISEEQSKTLFSNKYHKTEWVGALNAAYYQDGFYLHVSKNIKLDRPIIVHHLTDGENVANFPRHFVRIDEGGEAEVVVWTTASQDSSGMCNSLFEASIAPNAQLFLEKITNEEGEIYSFAHDFIIQEADSRFKAHNFTIKGSWVRNELSIVSAGKGTDTIFNGAYLPCGNEHVDNHTTMDHTYPDGTSSELYRGIMYGKSTGVFNGKVFVRPDAQRTNAFQQNTNIVADRGASINAKPELEIYADDVKCAHGCTVGQFDLEALFYLKSRGLDENAARTLLVEAFIADVLSSVPNEALRNEIKRLYSERHHWS
ncbi:MAG: Fe-S cluster assembly protein SufD [Bacteroidetes bacterium]|nr:MAG: Fe-S cluster assembly protein SufD [Bacteroidota bacterium]